MRICFENVSDAVVLSVNIHQSTIQVSIKLSIKNIVDFVVCLIGAAIYVWVKISLTWRPFCYLKYLATMQSTSVIERQESDC